MTDNDVYTVITFAPVQGFIEKSRKLRDLYGSSFLLSYLSWIICATAKSKGFEVVSPALIDVTQGTPNQIVVKGDFNEEDAYKALSEAWKCVTEACREWIEHNEAAENYYWKRNWDLWTKHAWEFFWVQGKTIPDARKRLNNAKYARDWTGINWQGESSTLSGADAIAYPELGKISDPRKYNYQQEKKAIEIFYSQLQQKLGESFIDTREELSIPELIKRIITHELVAKKIVEKLNNNKYLSRSLNLDEINKQIDRLSEELNPKSFRDLSRENDNKNDGDKTQNKNWTGWFQGDGDKAGDYLKKYPEQTSSFSKMMREWGKNFQEKSPLFCRVIYAGGDDFLGIFYDAKQGRSLDSSNCVKQLSRFKADIWDKPEKKPISASVGFVWAPPNVPQRDVLQHCREAEKSAKTNGRDRIAFRVLFNNGNYVEWVCPWWLLSKGLLSKYCDRSGNSSKPNWTHIYNDVAVLESRHAFTEHSVNIAFGLLEIYFPKQDLITIPDVAKQKSKKWWCQDEETKNKGIRFNQYDKDQDEETKNKGIWFNEYNKDKELIITGILGEKSYYKDGIENLDGAKVNQAFNNWVINLAKVGFYLCQQQKEQEIIPSN